MDGVERILRPCLDAEVARPVTMVGWTWREHMQKGLGKCDEHLEAPTPVKRTVWAKRRAKGMVMVWRALVIVVRRLKGD